MSGVFPHARLTLRHTTIDCKKQKARNHHISTRTYTAQSDVAGAANGHRSTLRRLAVNCVSWVRPLTHPTTPRASADYAELATPTYKLTKT
eukprot:7390135-Prymnesium_polylepis.2